MAGRNSESETADHNRITFQVERLMLVKPGCLEVSGRWFGVRGRRFVRPTLMLRTGGSAVRLLADLEHKPWATHDGEEWLATFPFDGDLEDATELELSVAPDIAVKLGDGSVSAASPTPESAPAQMQRAPRMGSDPGSGRPMLSERAREVERLNERLATLAEALDREHARRVAAEQELEKERTAALNLRSQTGRLRAQLDLAHAGQSEADSMSAEFDAARRALRRERAESEQLRSRLAQAESTAAEAESEAARARSTAVQARAAGAHAEPRSAPMATPRSAPMATPRSAPVAAPRSQPPVPRERPLNPSLRSRTNWLGRVLALLVILAVIAAVVLAIRTTVSP